MNSARPILDVAADLGLTASDLDPYGTEMAKVDLAVLDRPRRSEADNRLILVSAMTPSPPGEGKTTTTIGLAQGLKRRGERVAVALREPSLGPCMGMKGGGTGGGKSTLTPADRINLHFTGDLHAVTSAHNLLASMIDNHLVRGNELGFDSRRVVWKRVLDMNDRALRQIVTGLGGVSEGVPRETGFDITAASEVMAVLCLATDVDDLRRRLERLLVGFRADDSPVFARDVSAAGAMLVLLRDAIRPNLVQTIEGVPAFVHGGPFGNIAHGCNSVLATKMATHLSDWTVTEAGFGFDLGGEKFFDIKCVGAGIDTAAVVLVVTVQALKFHGGTAMRDIAKPDADAVRAGCANLQKHVENVRAFGERPIVALNKFDHDTDPEIDVVRGVCDDLGVPFVVSDHFQRGGEGAAALADMVVQHAEERVEPFRPAYRWVQPVCEKVEAVATQVYGAARVYFEPAARRQIDEIERLGFGNLPICIAKTHLSLSDDKRLQGRPEGFEATVRAVHINSGAGFLVVLMGDIMRMPGLPKRPLAETLDLREGRVVGLQ